MIISVVVVPAVLLLLFTVISFCGRVRLQHPFSESFHNVRLDFWLSPWKKMPFFFLWGGRGFPRFFISLTLYTFGGLSFSWESGNCWMLVIDASGFFFFFFMKFLSCKNKRKRKKLVLFEGKWGPKLFLNVLAKSQEKRPLLQPNELTLAPTMA